MNSKSKKSNFSEFAGRGEFVVASLSFVVITALILFRDEEKIRVIENYCKKQSLWHDKNFKKITYDKTLKLDLSKIKPKTVSHSPPLPINNVRINIECFAELYEKSTSRKQSYFVGSSCKTERVGVVQDFWTDPNADYLPIFSKQNYLIIKTFEHSQVSVPLYPPSLGVQPIRQYGSIEDNFSSFKTIINQSKARSITDYGKIIDLTFEGVPLNAITEIENEKYRFLIQYPIKTINVNEEVKMIQPDTGPILFSDLNHDFEIIMENF